MKVEITTSCRSWRIRKFRVKKLEIFHWLLLWMKLKTSAFKFCWFTYYHFRNYVAVLESMNVSFFSYLDCVCVFLVLGF